MGVRGRDRRRVRSDCKALKVRTKQEFKSDTDVNVVLERWLKAGAQVPQMPSGIEIDVSGIGDYQDCMNRVAAAQESFMALPSKARRRFDNDPKVFVDFCSNPSNIVEMVELGLAIKKPNPEVLGESTTPVSAA